MEAPPKRIIVKMDAPPERGGGTIAVFGGREPDPHTGTVEAVGSETATDIAPGCRVMLGTIKTALIKNDDGLFRIVKDSDIVGVDA